MAQARFITATGTPLTDDDQLHEAGLEQHLEDQAAGGIDALLVAGTMGQFQLQTEQTWRQLVRRSAQIGRGRFELLIGAADQSTSRTLDRIGFVNEVAGIDGVVVLTPSFIKFPESQLIEYYTHVADVSRYPIFIYDLQVLTGVHLSVETVCRLAEHRNIAGIKISVNVPEAVRIQSRLAGSPFRVIIAEPVISDLLFRGGYAEHLDGIYAICPRWATAQAEAARRDDWAEAARWQKLLTGIKELFLTYPFGPTFTAMMNLRGLPGRYAPRPHARPDARFIEQLRQMPVVQELLADAPAAV